MGSNRVNRGGSWNNNANNCRCANRNNNSPSNNNNNLGFRPANTFRERFTMFKDVVNNYSMSKISFLHFC